MARPGDTRPAAVAESDDAPPTRSTADRRVTRIVPPVTTLRYEQPVIWMSGVVLVWLLATVTLLPALGRLISAGQPPVPPPAATPPLAADSGRPQLRLVREPAV